MKKPLSQIQERVFDVLNAKPDNDVSIHLLYGAAFSGGNYDEVSLREWMDRDGARYMQQSLGAIFARINEKLEKGRVRPGYLKRTYRYDTQA